MKMRGTRRVLGAICYGIGIAAALYLGAWLMFLRPAYLLISALIAKKMTVRLLLVCAVKILLAGTVYGMVWCAGYMGQNFFRGKEDPDWDAIMQERTKKGRAKEPAAEDAKAGAGEAISGRSLLRKKRK